MKRGTVFSREDAKNIKLIATDLDHTLLTEKGEFPPNFDDCILRLNECNIDFAIASGRPLYTLAKIFAKTSAKISLIGDNGGIVCYKNNIIFKDILAPKFYQHMVNFTNEKTDGIAIICGLDCAYADKSGKKYENFLRNSYSNIEFIDTENMLNISKEADKFAIYFPNKNSAQNYESFFKPEYSADFFVSIGDAVWIDITNKGVNKGSALNVLAAKTGAAFDNMMAFGDTYNDVEMLKAVKYSFVVENSQAHMKKYANFMTDSNDNFGVMKILDKVLRSKKSKL